MDNNETKPPVISQHTTADALKINCVVLAENLLPVKFEDSRLVPASQAKELLSDYAQVILRRKAVAEITTKRSAALNSAQQRKKQKLCKMTAALGSTENIYSLRDCGLFSAVLTAYNNHWKLRTSPDDWWFSVIRRVACSIDKNANKESVRKMFVDDEEKKTIKVIVPDTSIYTVDYSWFFDQVAKGIQENVKVPEFVDGMTADFSTTTAVQKIVSQITLMFSVQEYFDFGMMTMCGIPAVEMLGTEEDWSKLKSKLKALRTLLEPIENDLDLTSEWWNLVEKVFRELLATYQGQPDRKWWSHIMSYERPFASGETPGYRGWITEFLEGIKNNIEIDEMSTGLVTVPLTIEDPISCMKDDATLVAGMLGFTMHTDDTSDSVSVQPFQGWSLLLSEDSPFRKKAAKSN